jgi:hypothetical protein
MTILRRLTRSATLTALSASTAAAVAASCLVPTTAADPVDRSTLPLQTQLMGGMWDNVRPLIDHDSLGDDQAFYTAPEGTDLQSLAPGTVLKERTVPYHVAGIEIPLTAVQILYTTTNARGEIEPNVTSVIAPPDGKSDGNVVAYQSAYDSANPKDNPSRIIAGNMSLGGIIPTAETTILAPALLAGHPVVLADTEGAGANFAAGPVYGRATLDSLRAAGATASSPVNDTDHIGFLGYSGGSIASGWAAALMPSYAPELTDRTVGVAEGGVLVNPVSNLTYAGDGIIWSGVVGFALTTLARTYGIDIDQYLTDYGVTVLQDLSNLSIVEAAARYPGLHWSDLAKPEYPTPESAPEVKKVIDEINLGNSGTPQVPMFMGQATGGFWEGTPNTGSQGQGDGIMVAGDVRSIARQYCEDGADITYHEYQLLSHVMGMVPWIAEALPWLQGRFDGAPVSNNCGNILPGNEL